MKSAQNRHQTGRELADQAKEELNQLMEELFVGKLRADLEAIYTQSSSVKRELGEKLDAQNGRLLWVQNELKKLVEDLPEQLKPLSVITEVKDTLDELCEGLAGRLELMETELKDKLQEASKGSVGEVSELNSKLVQTVLEYHTEVVRNTTGVINESFSQIASAVQTTAESLNHEAGRNQTELQAQLDSIRAEQTAQVAAAVKELEQQVEAGEKRMLAAVTEAEDRRKRHNKLGMGFLALQTVFLILIVYKLFI